MISAPVSPVLRDLPYGSGPRHVGDLHLPARRVVGASPAPVLLIHGGGWNALSKESLEPVARLFAEEGRVVFSINYRLLGHAPFPACRDDCLAAARFVLAGGLATHGLCAPFDGKLLVVGASAGGHLAMLTGLALGASACAGILSLAGPTRVRPESDDTVASAIAAPGFAAAFFGATTPDSAAISAATPTANVSPDAPPLFCLHSRNDLLVPLSHSEQAVSVWRAASVHAELYPFDGPGEQHGFWSEGDHTTRRLIPALDSLLRRIHRNLIRSHFITANLRS